MPPPSEIVVLLLQAIASNVGFRDPAANERRTRLFRELMSIARERVADAILLPGGYWTANVSDEVQPLAESICVEAERAGLVLIAGIDVQSAHGKLTNPKKGVKPLLPYYGFVGGNALSTRVWRQTSSDSRNALDVVKAEVPGVDRIVRLSVGSIGVLICGELFSSPARASMSALAPSVVVDLGHASMGTGVTPSMERIASDGKCAVAHTHHVVPDGNARLHFVAASGVRASVPVNDCDWIGDEDFWIAYHAREL
jgi:hypothetical protein